MIVEPRSLGSFCTFGAPISRRVDAGRATEDAFWHILAYFGTRVIAEKILVFPLLGLFWQFWHYWHAETGKRYNHCDATMRGAQPEVHFWYILAYFGTRVFPEKIPIFPVLGLFWHFWHFGTGFKKSLWVRSWHFAQRRPSRVRVGFVPGILRNAGRSRVHVGFVPDNLRVRNDVGWVERSETHRDGNAHRGFRCRSTHATQLHHAATPRLVFLSLVASCCRISVAGRLAGRGIGFVVVSLRFTCWLRFCQLAQRRPVPSLQQGGLSTAKPQRAHRGFAMARQDARKRALRLNPGYQLPAASRCRGLPSIAPGSVSPSPPGPALQAWHNRTR